ncbi:ribonuclease 3-like protein 3 [Vicia villosa]|uniref:ribonuclease 3-like protein 3 n=1 Tax=Vicia villosa TaxID=3911 RepID=UPI00273A8CF7|nr:ribonuclease 3-like protein 3 [Vicia villosa]
MKKLLSFVSCINFKVHNGFNTLFWESIWLDDSALKECFPDLYQASLLKNVLVAAMGGWMGGVWRWSDFGLSAALVDMADHREEFLELKKRVEAFRDWKSEKDLVFWSGNVDRNFSVASCYAFYDRLRIPFGPPVIHAEVFDFLWKMEIPFKIKAFGWRIFHERLPTKDLLAIRVSFSFVSLSLHTMAAQAHKELEETLMIQTCSLVIDDKEEEISPKQQEEKEETYDKDSLPPLPLDEVEAIIEYEFKNKHLLKEAFTHKTYGADNGLSYKRLEYVGDVVLNLFIVIEQYFSYPNLGPGVLTPNKSKNVDTEKLARVAIKHGLERYLRHKQPNLKDEIQRFIERVDDYYLHSNGQLYAPKALADIVESIIGAIFIDSNLSLDIVWKVARKLLEPIIEPESVKKHPVSQLIEICQEKKFKLQFVDLWEESTSVEIFINDKLVGRGSYGSKKAIARYRAAKNALDNIDNVLEVSTFTIKDAIEG